jgi:hypothetical protein
VLQTVIVSGGLRLNDPVVVTASGNQQMGSKQIGELKNNELKDHRHDYTRPECDKQCQALRHASSPAAFPIKKLKPGIIFLCHFF